MSGVISSVQAATHSVIFYLFVFGCAGFSLFRFSVVVASGGYSLVAARSL